MSDGITEANRTGAALDDVERGLCLFMRGMTALYDQAFGAPYEVVSELREGLARFGLHVVNAHGFTSEEIATRAARAAVAFVPPNERDADDRCPEERDG